MPSRFLNNITVNDEYTLPSADGTADQIITTDGAGQLGFVDQSTISAGNAEHVVIYAKNTSGSQINKGTPVYITGTVGATDTVQIAPADAGNASHMPAVGLLNDTLINNAFGYVITGGFMDNITTDPINGSTPNSNDTVYVKVGGGLTLTKPTGPTGLIQNVAKVGKVSGGNAGSLIVSSILRTNDVPNLTTGKIWVGDGNTVESTVVHLDETNERMGIGTTIPQVPLHIDIGTNNTGILVESSDTFARIVLKDQYGEGAIAALAANLLFSVGGSFTEMMRLNGDGNLGIGTTSPSEKLVVSKGTDNAGIKILSFNNAAGTEAALKFSTFASTNSYVKSAIIARNAAGSFGRNDMHFALDSAADGSNVQFSDTKMTILNGGDVGIGTTSPNAKLEIKTNNTTQIPLQITHNFFNDWIIQKRRSDNTQLIGLKEVNSNGGLGLATNNAVRMTVDNSGEVGIGTTSPSELLHISSLGPARLLIEADTDNVTETDNAQIILKQDGGAVVGNLGYKTNTNGLEMTNQYGAADGILTFGTSNTERIRVTHTGNVGIGTTSPDYKLEVDGTVTSSAGAPEFRLSDAVSDFLITTNTGGDGIIKTEGTSKNIRFFNNSGETMRISGNGDVGIGTTSPSYKLDVSGEGRFTGDLRCLSLIQTSQRDQKENINDIDKSKAKAIPFKEYTYKSSIDGSSRKRYGVVVEDIEDDYPELVHTDADGVKGVNYIDLLVKRVAELEKELEDISLTPGANGADGTNGTNGSPGAKGATGSAGSNGKNGSDGNSHLSNITSIGINGKSGQLEIVIGRSTYKFNPDK